MTVKKLGIISFRNFDLQDAKSWFPISFLLVTVIYTGSKSLVRPRSICYTPVINGRSLLGVNVGLLSGATAILEHSGIHYLQELDHHPHCTCIFLIGLQPSQFLMVIRVQQAYGEVLWFGGRVTALTLVSFVFMVSAVLSSPRP